MTALEWVAVAPELVLLIVAFMLLLSVKLKLSAVAAIGRRDCAVYIGIAGCVVYLAYRYDRVVFEATSVQPAQFAVES